MPEAGQLLEAGATIYRQQTGLIRSLSTNTRCVMAAASAHKHPIHSTDNYLIKEDFVDVTNLVLLTSENSN